MTNPPASIRPAPASMWRLPWFYGWNIVAVAILAQVLVSGVTLISFSLWVHDWMTTFHVQRAPIMRAMTVTLIVSGLAAPYIGHLFDRAPFRVLMSIGLGLFATGFALVSISTALWQVVLAYGLCLGAASALSGSVAAQVLASKWFRARAGLAIGIALTGLSLGGVLMPPLLAALMAAFGWREAALIIGALGLAVIPVILLVIRNRPEDLGLQPEAEGKIPPPETSWTVRQILLNPNFWLLVAAFVPFFTALKAIAANFEPLAADLGVTASTAALLISANNAFTIVGKVVIGRLSDLFDPRIVLAALIAMGGAGFLLMLGHAGFDRLIIGNCLLGLGSAGVYPMQGILIRRYFGLVSFGRVIGLLNLFFLLSAFGGQWAGASRDRSGDYNLFLLAAGVAPVLCGLAVLLMRRREN
jgi:predicted MFS family arabinose efflux permease